MGRDQSMARVDWDRTGKARAPDLHCNDERTELPPRRLEADPDKKPDRTIPHHLRPLRKTGVFSATPRPSWRASPPFGCSEVQRSPKPPRRPQGLPPLTHASTDSSQQQRLVLTKRPIISEVIWQIIFGEPRHTALNILRLSSTLARLEPSLFQVVVHFTSQL